MLMKALGCNAFAEPDVMVKGFLKDDILIMCSDGLTNLVGQETLYEMASQNIEQATKDLVNLAKEKGGYDNITVIIIKNIFIIYISFAFIIRIRIHISYRIVWII